METIWRYENNLNLWKRFNLMNNIWLYDNFQKVKPNQEKICDFCFFHNDKQVPTGEFKAMFIDSKLPKS